MTNSTEKEDFAMREEWRDVAGYEGYYQISNLGRIKGAPRQACNGSILKQHLSTTGYPTVSLSVGCVAKHKTVHRLLAEAFIPNPNNLPEVNHINGDKTDYRLSNLEWCSHRENMQHAVMTGLLDPLKSQKISAAKMRKTVVRDDGAVFASLHEAAEKSGTCAGNVCKVLKGIRPLANGHSFEYVEDAS